MVRRLDPDSQRFHKSHKAWVERTSKLIENSEPGTVFGLFGGWGTGKSSAAMAVSERLMVGGNNFALRVETPALVISSKGIEEFVALQLKQIESCFEDGSEGKESWSVKYLVGRISNYLISLASLASKAGPEDFALPLSAGMTVAGVAGLHYAENEGKDEPRNGDSLEGFVTAAKRSAASDENDPEGTEWTGKVIVVLDDLDRCAHDEAWKILKGARILFGDPRFRVVVVCDNTVLGKHVSSALGVSVADGFAAVGKYIDVPLRVPRHPASTAGDGRKYYKEKIDEVLGAFGSLPELSAAALDFAGGVPFREVLAALPQAACWFQDAPPSGENTKGPIAEWVLTLSLIHSCLPNAFDVLTAALRIRGGDAATALLFSLVSMERLGDSSGEGVNAFGEHVVATLNSRTGLMHFLRGRDKHRQTPKGDGPATFKKERAAELIGKILT